MKTQNLKDTRRIASEIRSSLDHIFYSDKFLMGNLSRLQEAVKKKGLKIPTDITKLYYDNQAVVQILAPPKKYISRPTVRLIPFSRVYVDTTFIDDKAIVVFVDGFSRYAFAVGFKQPINSEKALTAFQLFVSAVEELGYSENDIRDVRSDAGSEFKMAFDEAMKATKYRKHTTSLAGAKNEMSLVERFNRTLKTILTRLFEVRGKPVNWLTKYLPIALKGYNNASHDTTGISPIEALTDKGARSEAQTRLRKRLQEKVAEQGESDEINKGDTVRIFIRDRFNAFDKKVGANWSRELYKVTAYDKQNRRYEVNGEWYKAVDLQKINPELLMGVRVAKTVLPVVIKKEEDSKGETGSIATSVKSRKDRRKETRHSM